MGLPILLLRIAMRKRALWWTGNKKQQCYSFICLFFTYLMIILIFFLKLRIGGAHFVEVTIEYDFHLCCGHCGLLRVPSCLPLVLQCDRHPPSMELYLRHYRSLHHRWVSHLPLHGIQQVQQPPLPSLFSFLLFNYFCSSKK